MIATNPWVAWPSGADPAELAARLRAAHELFMTGGVPDAGRGPGPGRMTTVRRVVLDSWLRSRSSGVDPERLCPPVDLSTADLAAYRREHVLAPLMPMVRRLLLDGGGSDGMIVALADVSGRLLWLDGDRAVRRDLERAGFVEGASWSEQDAGTNAPGIALATNHEVQIFAAEHFTRAVQPWSCSAAPVHDPVTGRILGVLDITGRDPAASPQMLSLVRATTAAMESELALRALQQRFEGPRAGTVVGDASFSIADAGSSSAFRRGPSAVHAPPWAAARLEVLGTSSGTLVRGGERQALTLRHSELLVLLGAHPLGLTGDELGALLHPGTLSDVTVRAEMSRLRRAVGVVLGESRPYRLAAKVRTDIDQVRERLARGDAAGAVQLYRGPILPRSEAPGVGELRAELAAEVRTALIRTGDVNALEAWTLGPGGTDDWEAWQQLLRLHRPGSPGWIRARAHADVLDHELGVAPAPTAKGRPAPRRRPAMR